MPLKPKTFLYEMDSATGVATVTLNRPDRLNALTFEVYEELRDFFLNLDTEPGVRAIILTGAGRAFCSGSGRRSRLTKPSRRCASVTCDSSRNARTARTSCTVLNGIPVVASR